MAEMILVETDSDRFFVYKEEDRAMIQRDMDEAKEKIHTVRRVGSGFEFRIHSEVDTYSAIDEDITDEFDTVHNRSQ